MPYPIHIERDRNIKVAVWPRTFGEGKKKTTFYNLQIQRGFKRKGSESWENQNITLGTRDVVMLKDLLDRSVKAIENEDFNNPDQEDPRNLREEE